MTQLEKFHELKKKVLLKYQEQYTFFQGNWKSFSAQDIQNLIGLIEVNCKQTVSEKWIYTHLKPEINSKVPRKDMLNILSKLVGFSGWDEFIFEDKIFESKELKESKKSKKMFWFSLLILIFVIVIAVGFFHKKELPKKKTIELNNQFTNEKVNSEEMKVFQVEDSVTQELEIIEGKVQVSNADDKKTKLVIQSPFYEPKTVVLHPNQANEPQQTIDLKPDDYAMMLKAFMLSDNKDWQTRKERLNTILANNLEVIVMLKNDLGSEYLNKNEFSQKLIVPTSTVRKMKIVEIKNDANKKIQFIRIKQE